MIDPKDKRDRFLMFIPGFITWTMLLMPFWLGFLWPKAASFILTFLAIYWVYMSINYAIGLYKGYKKYKKEILINWFNKCKELDFSKLPNNKQLPKTLDGLHHFILIPTVKETFDIMGNTFQTLIDQSVPTKNITIIIGTEEMGKEIVSETIKRAKAKWGKELPRILHYIHPKGISGEIVGVASPNRTWAAKHAVEQLRKENIPLEHFIFTTFDADTTLHKEFLARIAYEYLTEEKRFNKFFQTNAYFFHNNIWDVPSLARIEANNITFGLLSNWTIGETFSCYSTALDTLIIAKYWDVKFIDDTVFFWRALIAREGDFTPTYFHIPISQDATDGKNYINAHFNLFRQLLRWGWGSISTVIALKYLFLGNLKKITLSDKIYWAYNKIERHGILRTTVFLITFGFTIVTYVNVQFGNTSTVYGLPKIISTFLTGGMFMFIPLAIIRWKIYTPPTKWPKWKRLLTIFEGLLVILDLLTFSFFPWLIAETRMMFGYTPKVTFYTPKTRKNK